VPAPRWRAAPAGTGMPLAHPPPPPPAKGVQLAIDVPDPGHYREPTWHASQVVLPLIAPGRCEHTDRMSAKDTLAALRRGLTEADRRDSLRYRAPATGVLQFTNGTRRAYCADHLHQHRITDR